jgi:hypothetical protein
VAALTGRVAGEVLNLGGRNPASNCGYGTVTPLTA